MLAAADLPMYISARRKALKNAKQLQAYLSQLTQVLNAMPADASAGYLDLDNAQQIEGDLEQAVELVCDWDSLGLEFSRFSLGAPT